VGQWGSGRARLTTFRVALRATHTHSNGLGDKVLVSTVVSKGPHECIVPLSKNFVIFLPADEPGTPLRCIRRTKHSPDGSNVLVNPPVSKGTPGCTVRLCCLSSRPCAKHDPGTAFDAPASSCAVTKGVSTWGGLWAVGKGRGSCNPWQYLRLLFWTFKLRRCCRGVAWGLEGREEGAQLRNSTPGNFSRVELRSCMCVWAGSRQTWPDLCELGRGRGKPCFRRLYACVLFCCFRACHDAHSPLCCCCLFVVFTCTSKGIYNIIIVFTYISKGYL
jgi:hypothetical protein